MSMHERFRAALNANEPSRYKTNWATGKGLRIAGQNGQGRAVESEIRTIEPTSQPTFGSTCVFVLKDRALSMGRPMLEIDLSAIQDSVGIARNPGTTVFMAPLLTLSGGSYRFESGCGNYCSRPIAYNSTAAQVATALNNTYVQTGPGTFAAVHRPTMGCYRDIDGIPGNDVSFNVRTVDNDPTLVSWWSTRSSNLIIEYAGAYAGRVMDPSNTLRLCGFGLSPQSCITLPYGAESNQSVYGGTGWMYNGLNFPHTVRWVDAPLTIARLDYFAQSGGTPLYSVTGQDIWALDQLCVKEKDRSRYIHRVRPRIWGANAGTTLRVMLPGPFDRPEDPLPLSVLSDELRVVVTFNTMTRCIYTNMDMGREILRGTMLGARLYMQCDIPSKNQRALLMRVPHPIMTHRLVPQTIRIPIKAGTTDFTHTLGGISGSVAALVFWVGLSSKAYGNNYTIMQRIQQYQFFSELGASITGPTPVTPGVQDLYSHERSWRGSVAGIRHRSNEGNVMPHDNFEGTVGRCESMPTAMCIHSWAGDLQSDLRHGTATGDLYFTGREAVRIIISSVGGIPPVLDMELVIMALGRTWTSMYAGRMDVIPG